MIKRYPKPTLVITKDTVGSYFHSFSDDFDREMRSELSEIAKDARDFWKAQAAIRLKTTLKGYQKSIVVSKHLDKVTLSLGGRGGNATAVERWLSVAMETGIPEFSMKPGYLKGGLTSRVIPLQTKDKGLIFRTVRDTEQKTPWAHPGFKPLNLKDLVIEELAAVIVPEHVQKIIDRIK